MDRRSRRWARWPLDHHHHCPQEHYSFLPTIVSIVFLQLQSHLGHWSRLLKMGHPRPLFHLFSIFFKQTLHILQRDSNSRPSEYESPPLTTRLRLPPKNIIIIILTCEIGVQWSNHGVERRPPEQVVLGIGVQVTGVEQHLGQLPVFWLDRIVKSCTTLWE